jgi:Tol biopolymer transport system component
MTCPKQLLLLFFTLLFLSPSIARASLPAVQATDDPYTLAYLKWDAGDYIGALEDFLTILDSEDAELYFDDIATLTGELYVVNELSEDGRNPVFSPDNRHFAWQETSNGITRTLISRITDSGTERIHALEGTGLVFSPDGRHAALFRSTVTERMEQLGLELSDAIQARDRDAILRTRNELRLEEIRNTHLYRADLQNGASVRLQTGSLMVQDPVFDEDGTLYFTGTDPDNPGHTDIYRMPLDGGSPEAVTGSDGYLHSPIPVPGSNRLILRSSPQSTFPSVPGVAQPELDTPESVVLFDLNEGEITRWEGSSPVISQSGNRVAFMMSKNGETGIFSADLTETSPQPEIMTASLFPIQNPALSPDGSNLAYMLREGISWNLHMVHTADATDEQLSFDIQHELFPHFLNNDKVLGMMGESRHRRSHIYDVQTKEFHRLFHNNSVRTVSMENEWEPSPDGHFMLVVAQRSGNTIAPEQGVYLVRIGERISKETLIERLEANLESERTLLANAEEMYGPIRDAVQLAVDEVNITRMWHYQKSLYDFGSKHITRPGNRKAMEYIYETLESFGYKPEYQWFNPAYNIETANVIARLEGTTHPEVVYILSSHFDSVQRSPGADDNTSGTAVLLETARVLAKNPQPATIIFASLTGEESGLLGAREFTRVAGEEGLWAMGVINNDMMGWTRHHRLDNTIRFSNYGIRDIQHSGAILFTDLITYDSRYYRNTDAHAFFDAYGDVIGGIGSYPILGNPNYHQTTDRLETINHNLLREVAKSNIATFMMLASAPSKVTGLNVMDMGGNRAMAQWNANPESDIDHYIVNYTDMMGNPHSEVVEATEATLRRADLSKTVTVVAVNNRGMKGWDPTLWQ